MKNALFLALTGLAIAMTLVVIDVAASACRLMETMEKSANALVASWSAAPASVTAELRGLRAETRAEVAALRAATQAELGNLARTFDTRASSIQTDAREQTQSIVCLLDARTDDLLREVARARADAGAAVGEVQVLAVNVNRAVTLLTPQVLGTFAAAKVATGEVASAARKIDDAVPQFITTLQRAGDEYRATGEETRVAMHNLAVATKPLPRWIRYPLSITGALAPTVGGALGAAAATGAFR